MDGRPDIGASVISADGNELGKLVEYDGDCFKVDVPLQPGYWLAPDVIETTSPSTVQLLITRDELPAVFVRDQHKGYHLHRST